MNFFSLIQKKGTKPIPPAPSSVRKEVVYGLPTPKTITKSKLIRPYSAPPALRKNVSKADRPRETTPLHKNGRRRKQTGQARLLSDSESSDAATDLPRKRLKVVGRKRSSEKRQLRCISAFTQADSVASPLVHAADIASLEKGSKYKLAFPQDPQHHLVKLRYPSASQHEMFVYELLFPEDSVG